MSDPIPDEVLRDFSANGRVWYCVDMDGSSEGKPFSSAIWGQDLARDLLALREAARRIFDGMSGTWAEVDPPTLDAIRALLPEEPK